MKMNIKGLDYNTTRERLILPEYGREIQKMIDYAVALPDKAERQRCAETIIAVMDRMLPHNRDNSEYKRKLWDHLAIMSNFKLDIDYPYDISSAAKIATKPQPMGYPMKRIPVRHYGNLVFEMLSKLKNMEPGAERDALVSLTAKQMKRDLMQWSHGASSDEKVVADMERFTDGIVSPDLHDLQNTKFSMPAQRNNAGKKGKRRTTH